MTTLITGGCGFVGINLVEALVGRGEPVVVFDRHALPAEAVATLQAAGGALPTQIQGDVRDRQAVESALRAFQVDRVVHAAVVTSGAARESVEPGEVIAINIGGTVAVLEAARAAGCRRVVSVSSGSAYGQTLEQSEPVREAQSPSRPETLYGITKFAAEASALRLRTLWNHDIICTRLGSVFGPWEHGTGARDRLSPQLQLARIAIAGGTAVLPLREVRRDWVYSRDVAAGIETLLFAKSVPHALYHLSSGRAWEDFFPRWCETLKAAFPTFSWHVAEPGEAANVAYHAEHDRAAMDMSRIAADIGFRPAFGAQEACSDLGTWVRAHQAFISAPDRPHHLSRKPAGYRPGSDEFTAPAVPG